MPGLSIIKKKRRNPESRDESDDRSRDDWSRDDQSRDDWSRDDRTRDEDSWESVDGLPQISSVVSLNRICHPGSRGTDGGLHSSDPLRNDGGLQSSDPPIGTEGFNISGLSSISIFRRVRSSVKEEVQEVEPIIVE